MHHGGYQLSKHPIIVGRAALIVVDIQQSDFELTEDDHHGIPSVDDAPERYLRVPDLIKAARGAGVPVIFIREVHRPDMVDFGRELDGAEGVHCVETEPGTVIAREMGALSTDYYIDKRRYSAFFGTDFEILLKGLKIDTLILTGGLTDVCVHYTFVDAHQHDYFVRVIEDCVAGSSERAHDAALDAMEYLQSGARRSRQDVLDALATVPA